MNKDNIPKESTQESSAARAEDIFADIEAMGEVESEALVIEALERDDYRSASLFTPELAANAIARIRRAQAAK